MKKYWKYIYTVLFLLIILVASAGLFFGGREDSQENGIDVEIPSLVENHKFNIKYLSKMGDYFEKNFAFRKEFVSAYDAIMDKVFFTSGQDGVIVGEKDWLYYKDSLDDFQGRNQMTDRQLFDAAHTLAMIQNYAQKKGISFVFTIAPNKNHLYPENMPFYYSGFRERENNFTRIQPFLREEGVNYVDLYSVLKKQKEVLYHTRDSHWTNKGASLAADAILTNLGITHRNYKNCSYSVKKDFIGDLYGMLYPAGSATEKEIYFQPEPEFSYVEKVENNFAAEIRTTGSGAGRSLVMYRDSFGNALLPFMAESYQNAYFSRGEPYPLSDLVTYDADTLVIEKAERFLPKIAERPPVMSAPIVSSSQVSDEQYLKINDYDIEELGNYTCISGLLGNEKIETRDRIFIRVNGLLNYEAFPMSTEKGEGYSLCLPTSLLKDENTFEMCIKK